MGIETGAAIIGGSLISGYLGNKAADKQADATRDAANQSNALQRYMFDKQYADQAPYREAGVNALAKIGEGSGGYNAFKDSDYYKTAGEYAQRALNRQNSAAGITGGANVMSNSRLGAGLYQNWEDNWYNRLASQAGIGQTSVAQTGAAGQNAANAMSQGILGAGNARASAYGNAYGAMNNAVQGGISNYMLYDYLKKPGVGANAFGTGYGYTGNPQMTAGPGQGY